MLLRHLSLVHRCPPGKRLVTHGSFEQCENIDECSEHMTSLTDSSVTSLCHHGTCHDTDDGYYCECHAGFTGRDCSVALPRVTVLVSDTALVAIIASGITVVC